jgi:uncharacterized protein YdhG (YjbR/CyaY superfamily)
MPKAKPAAKGAKGSATEFTAEERAAMRARVKELKARATRAEQEHEAEEAIAAMQPSDRVIAERIHAIVKANAPNLSPKTWYGMPAYADGDRIVCFVQPAEKFKVRYATLGFADGAKLDEGRMWPTVYAITELTTSEEARIVALVKKAVG